MSLLKKLLIYTLSGLTLLAFAFMLSGAFFLWICAPDNPNDYNAHDLALYQQTMTASIVGIISGIAAALLSGITKEDL